MLLAGIVNGKFKNVFLILSYDNLMVSDVYNRKVLIEFILSK